MAGDWKIDEVLGAPVTAFEENDAFISFQKEESRFYGSTGCNSFFGNFVIEENSDNIRLENIGSTKKLCENMALEDSIFYVFGKVASVRYDNNKMHLLGKNGNVLMKLSIKN